MPSDTTSTAWHYPFWIAHRGAGKLAPENTLAAFRLGAQYGWRMFECDVKLSADNVPFLLHDATLERTSNGQGVAGALNWGDLAQLDAGSWHSRNYAGETLPTLKNIAEFCVRNHLLIDIEIKPTPGTEYHTGKLVAQHVAQLWHHAPIAPLLTSFSTDALAAAREAQPELPRGLLLDTLPSAWLEQAQQLQCQALVCNHALWDSHTVEKTRAAGLRCLSYTVNDETAAQRLIALGTHGIVSDRVDLFSPSSL